MTDGQKILLLTGASRGIGHATVQKFNAEGWRVLTCSRHPFPEQCPWGGGEENHVQIDLADPKNTIEAIDAIRDRLGGKLHALVNNAGISPNGEGGARLNPLDTGNALNPLLEFRHTIILIKIDRNISNKQVADCLDKSL